MMKHDVWADCSHIAIFQLFFLNNAPHLHSHTEYLQVKYTHSYTLSHSHTYAHLDVEVTVTLSQSQTVTVTLVCRFSFSVKRRTYTQTYTNLHLHTNIDSQNFTTHCSSLSGHSKSYIPFSGVRVTHTLIGTYAHKKPFPSETAAVPIRPQVCSNSKLPHRDQSQFISVRLLVTETEALTEVKLTNLPTGKYQPAHILLLYTGVLRRLPCFTKAQVFLLYIVIDGSVHSSLLTKFLIRSVPPD